MGTESENDEVQLNMYIREVDVDLAASEEAIMRVGHTLLRADKNLTGPAFRKLEQHILNRGHKKSDIRAWMAAARGELDARLLHRGAPSSKLLNLPSSQQERLLSEEPILVQKVDGPVPRTWETMTPVERDQVLGSKGARIEPPETQTLPGTRKPKAAVITVVVATEVAVRGNQLFLLLDGRDVACVELGALKDAGVAKLLK